MAGVLLERSDVDPHESLDKSELGEDWGEGFFVNPAPMRINRDAQGNIVRASPIGDLQGMAEEMQSARQAIKEVSPTRKPNRIPMSDRHKVVTLLANKMMEFYTSEEQMKNMEAMNPVRDGIPVCDHHPDGCWNKCGAEARPRKIQTTGGAVYKWLLEFIGRRATIIDQKDGAGPANIRLSREVLS